MHLTPPSDYAALEARFLAWAAAQPALRAAVVVGSRARPEPPHPLSDLDLILFTTTPAVFAAASDWLAALGPIWTAVRNDTGGGDPEWLVLYAGGLKADFVLTPTPESASLADRLRASPYRNVYRRGVRVLYNHRGPPALPAEWLRAPLDPPLLPDQAAFTAGLHAAWYAADRAARLLARGDLWRAHQQVDSALKQALLQMLAWHAHARPGAPARTWDDGRDLARWADPAAFAALPAAFAAHAGPDLWRALFATLALFHRLARETAQSLRYPYPAETEAAVLDWLRQVHAST